VGITSRSYIFDKDGALKRIPQRVLEALPFGQDAIPEYGGTRQRVATVIIENEGGKPVRILDAQGEFWTFDNEGRIDENLQQVGGEAFSLKSLTLPPRSNAEISVLCTAGISIKTSSIGSPQTFGRHSMELRGTLKWLRARLQESHR
jgi:hypothetical protein